MMHLSGLTLQPSMVSRGVESWIASLAATRANHSAMQESDRARQTRATSGQILPVLWMKSSPPSASSRMYQDIYLWDSQRSPRHLKTWATALRQESSRQQKLVQAMNEKDCTYWRTPTVAQRSPVSPQNMLKRMERGFAVTLPDFEMMWKFQMWNTPLASSKGASQVEIDAGNPRGRLECQEAIFSRLCSAMIEVGYTQSTTRANPSFREWLMGLPIGWTDWQRLAMPYAQWQQQMRSQLLWAQSIETEEPEQMELFS